MEVVRLLTLYLTSKEGLLEGGRGIDTGKLGSDVVLLVHCCVSGDGEVFMLEASLTRPLCFRSSARCHVSRTPPTLAVPMSRRLRCPIVADEWAVEAPHRLPYRGPQPAKRTVRDFQEQTIPLTRTGRSSMGSNV